MSAQNTFNGVQAPRQGVELSKPYQDVNSSIQQPNTSEPSVPSQQYAPINSSSQTVNPTIQPITDLPPTQEQPEELINQNSNEVDFPEDEYANQEFEDQLESEFTDGEDTTNQSTLIPGLDKLQSEELLYQWIAPNKVQRFHSKRYYVNTIILALLVGLILFFAGQWPLFGVVVALVFLWYISQKTPPHDITHQFTTLAIRSEGKVYMWEELNSFWTKKEQDQTIFYIEVDRFPFRIHLLVGKGDEELIYFILNDALLEHEPLPTFYEKAANWLKEKLPLDLES